MEIVSRLCGSAHEESKDLAAQFQKSLARSYMSVSNERAEEIAQRNPELPILNKYEFPLDEQVVKDSSISPLLVRKRPENTLALPEYLRLKIKSAMRMQDRSLSKSPRRSDECLSMKDQATRSVSQLRNHELLKKGRMTVDSSVSQASIREQLNRINS